MKFTIRAMKRADYQFVYSLIRENMESYYMQYWGGWDDKNFKEGLETGIIKIVEINNQKVGLIHYGFFAEYAYIYNIQLDAEHRNQGLGTQLLRKIEVEVKKKAINKIRLTVFKSNPAMNLYKRLNYTKIIEDYASHVILEKEL